MGREKLKEKKTRMRVLTNFDETISLELILNSLRCDSWTMNNLLPMDHSCWFHIPCKANSKLTKHPALTTIPGYFHLDFHRKGTPPALLIGSSSSCSRISVFKTMKCYHRSSAKAPTSSKFNTSPTKKSVLELAEMVAMWTLWSILDIGKISSDKREIFWWLLQHWYNDINTWKLHIYIYIYQNIKMNRY